MVLHGMVTLRSPEHEVLKQVLVLQSNHHDNLVLSFERQAGALVGTHARIADEELPHVLARLELVEQDWTVPEFSAS